MTVMATERLAGRSLVSIELFDRLAARIAKTEGLEPTLAARVVDQALAFLGACAVHRGGPLSPSMMVDPGWHAFVLHTREYREFCQRVAGRFIDHMPTERTQVDTDRPGLALHRTVAAIRAIGYAVDDELWFRAGDADCTGCANGCHDDPPPMD